MFTKLRILAVVLGLLAPVALTTSISRANDEPMNEWYPVDSIDRGILEKCVAPIRDLLARGTRVAGLWVGGGIGVQLYRFTVENVIAGQVTGSATLEFERSPSGGVSCGTVQSSGQSAGQRDSGPLLALMREPFGAMSLDIIRVSLIEHCYASFSTLLSRGDRFESVTHYQAPTPIDVSPPWPTLTFTVSGLVPGSAGRTVTAMSVVERQDWTNEQGEYLHQCGPLSSGQLSDEPGGDGEPGGDDGQGGGGHGGHGG